MEVRVGIITALSKEFAAMRAAFGCQQEITSPSGYNYALSNIHPSQGTSYGVAIALLPDMGNNMAAVMTTHLLRDFPNVRYVIMGGIAGAVPYPFRPEHHVRLGDIVVSDRSGVVQYDLTKEMPEEVEHRHPPRPPAALLLQAIKMLEADELLNCRPWEDVLDSMITGQPGLWKRPRSRTDRLQDWNDGMPPTRHPKDPARRAGHPRVFHGVIASSNTLLKNPPKRDMLRDQFGIKAVEMEGSGVADAAWVAETGYLIIRGTCDYCNKDKGNSWQLYAAALAAAYTRAVLERLTLPPLGSVIPEPFSPVRIEVPEIARTDNSPAQNSMTTIIHAANVHIQQNVTPSLSPDTAGTAELMHAVERLTAHIDAVGISGNSPTQRAESDAEQQLLLDKGQTLIIDLKQLSSCP